ncbi:hypothetical protein B0H65DRAFT_73739 [Neurospora tetraspora]|uniref:Uncharacterized protein n=1 Tax=Neurospora tetraspora TaxID=94610 RepID=A0AAE0JR65_9PEZI|nr:hypothetical protein B0H65DRAFT_73739 [Neurospora tetraspora]
MLPIKTEPGVVIKSEHEARFDFSIPRPPVPSAPVKQEDRKPDLFSSTYDGQSRRRRRFRHANNFMVHRLRHGETIRAHYNQSESTVVFTLSRGAAAAIDGFPEEGHRAEEMIFQRLRRANFNIQPTESSGFLCRKVQRLLSLLLSGPSDVVSVEVEQIFGHSHAPEAVSKQEQTKSESKPVAPTIPSFAEHIQHGHVKPPPLSASSSGRSQPAAHIPQVPSSTPVLQKPSEGIFDMFRPKEQSKIFSHHIASENRSSPSLDSSSNLTSSLFGGSGDQSTRSSRSVFSHSFSETKSPVPSKPAIWPTNSSILPSLFGSSGATSLFVVKLPLPNTTVPAAAVKPAPEVIVIDSSPKSSPASFLQQPLPKKRAAETKDSVWPTSYSQSASPFFTLALGKTGGSCDGSTDENPMLEKPVRSSGKGK